MSAAENKKIVENLFTAISRGDAAAYLDGLAEDVEFKIQGTTKFSDVFKGKQDVVARLLTPLMSGLEGPLTLTVDKMIAEGDTVVVVSHGRSTTKTGKPYNNSYCQVLTVAGGKVKRIDEYLDTELVTQAFGK